jgi:short-subunit dehydrogenase
LAVVTGASSGIGRELARVAARNGYDLIVVARRADRLAALASELAAFGGTTEQVVVDLAQSGGAQAVVEAVADRPVEVLVNDAGVGGRGLFATERQLATDLAMIQLNVTTLVELTGLLLSGMLERRRGGILNVASIAGYLPGPHQAVYNASKAFVKSFRLSARRRATLAYASPLCARARWRRNSKPSPATPQPPHGTRRCESHPPQRWPLPDGKGWLLASPLWCPIS